MVDVKTANAADVGFDVLDPAADPADFDGLLKFVGAKLDDIDGCFALPQQIAFDRKDDLVTFASAGGFRHDSPNNLALAKLYQARGRDRAVVLLPFWNSQRRELAAFGRALAACGITCLQLSLPYHDERQTPGVGFARELACENLGLTLHANVQAVLDARACLTWLERAGYRRLGILGISLGSSVGSIVAALDPRVRAAALILMAGDFAETIWTGSATRHVRQSLERRFTLDEVRRAWRLISSATYAERLAQRLDRVLIVSGELDPVFIPELTRRYVEQLRQAGGKPIWARYGCGHYTLGLMPYAVPTFLRTVSYLRARL
jgi:pimeloyl-ACP methyl ester carboxylesterase